jgi:hypothetical protein
MSKMNSHDPFGHFKHKLWSKEGPRIKLSIWFPTIKSQESPWFPFVKVSCNISLESSWQGLQLCFRSHPIRRSIRKVMGLQSCESPKTKWHLGVSPVAKHKVYYNGEGGGFPQVRAVVSLVSLCLPMAHPYTKSVLATH